MRKNRRGRTLQSIEREATVSPTWLTDRHGQFNRAGGCLLVSGMATMLLTATLAFSASPTSPDAPTKAARSPGRKASEASTKNVVSLAEFRANWPRFRGTDGSGVSAYTNVPLKWDGKTGAGIVWKSPVPAPGYGSPVVWANRVFLSGGDAAARFVFCYDASNGKFLWQRSITNVPDGQPKKPEKSEIMAGVASCTTASDGRRVFAIFATGELAVFTLNGSPVWSKNIGVIKNMYGHASSLAIWPGKLILQVDQDEGAPGGSKLFAFDCATGRLLWKRSRESESSWATPIIVEAASKTQIITLGQPWIVAYALADGSELWRAEMLQGEVTASPIFAGGLVIAINPSAKLLAIRPDGAGNVTKSHIAWAVEDNIPDVTSPVSNGELVFVATSAGILTCLDANGGKKQWEHDLKMEVQSSPSVVGDKLFLLGTKGVAVVAEAGRQFKEVSRSELPDEFIASPAFANGRIFLRGATNLWCLGEKKRK